MRVGRKQAFADRQKARTPPVGHKAEKADTDESARKGVQQKAPQELVDCQGHQLVLATILVIFPTKCNFAFRKGNQPMIGDGDAVRVMGQIF